MATAKEINLEIIPNWATVRPGDTLLIASRDKMSDREAEDMKMRIQELLPRVMVIIVPANQMMVYRPDGL